MTVILDKKALGSCHSRTDTRSHTISLTLTLKRIVHVNLVIVVTLLSFSLHFRCPIRRVLGGQIRTPLLLLDGFSSIIISSSSLPTSSPSHAVPTQLIPRPLAGYREILNSSFGISSSHIIVVTYTHQPAGRKDEEECGITSSSSSQVPSSSDHVPYLAHLPPSPNLGSTPSRNLSMSRSKEDRRCHGSNRLNMPVLLSLTSKLFPSLIPTVG